MSTAAAQRRIVVADDSRLMRRVLRDACTRLGYAVVAEAADGDEALAACRTHRPDAMTLDLHMPGLDGISVLKRLRGETAPPPVVVVSAFSPRQGAHAVEALAEGAFELLAKPSMGDGMDTFGEELGRKLEAAVTSRRAPRRRALGHPQPGAAPAPALPPRRGTHPRTGIRTERVLLIASSTGGPQALNRLVPALPGRLPRGAACVQHMPAGFTASLSSRLDGASRLGVREAADGDALDPRSLLIAPGGRHLRMRPDGKLWLSDEAPVTGLRPRADLLIADAVEALGSRIVLVVLTGMGSDGLEGARRVRSAGGKVLCEAESSCVVYGMPRSVVDAGLADAVAPLDELAPLIAEETGA